MLTISASKYIKQGRLGLNDDMTVATFPSWQFFLTKLISLFGASFYLTIIASMLGAFSCSLSDSAWHLIRYPSMACFSDEHLVYFILAIICIIFYYPIATLLYPNIVFQDKALDIKFNTTFLVLESQGKVIIAGFFVFFPKELYIWLQLIASIVVSGSLFLYCLKYRPCLIKFYNLWKTGGFLIPVWICTCALINYYSRITSVALSLLIIGVVLIISGIIVLHYRKYGFTLCGDPAMRDLDESRRISVKERAIRVIPSHPLQMNQSEINLNP